ncbi:hypothetical protein PNEG_03589 [Pneumocystis murina B123]|uniref:FHA domain-containing protein n=1 Tax=Pneumocystis murina (strain B123) TaxID=1069680 RepID=M7NLT1_PNEMU|nr:hypothetical protein PNEG_03589 [Pneumocystis murina B123]EMR08152.1 hypothetical protein PNEG_03589 [Pneumocystis murina B123]
MACLFGTLYVLRKGTEEEYAHFPITKRLNTFGRHLSCDVRLYDEVISRQHARLEIDDNGNAFLENLSVNGTFVNNNELDISENKKFRLNTGDIISLSGHKFRWEYPTNEKKDNQVVIHTPELKTYTPIKSIKQSSFLFANDKDVFDTYLMNEKPLQPILKENLVNEHVSIKIKTPKNNIVKSKILDVVDSGLRSKESPLGDVKNLKILASSIENSPEKQIISNDIFVLGPKDFTSKDKYDTSLPFSEKNIEIIKKENFNHNDSIKNKVFSPAKNSILDQDFQMPDLSPASNIKINVSPAIDKSMDDLILNRYFESKGSDVSLDSLLVEKKNMFSEKENDAIDLNSSLKIKRTESEQDDGILLHPVISLSKILPEKKISTSGICNNFYNSRGFKLEEDVIVSPPKEKSFSIFPDAQPSPLKFGSPVLHLVKKYYVDTRDLPRQLRDIKTKRHVYKKRPSFPPFIASKVLNNPALTNLRSRHSISDPSLPLSAYINKVEFVSEKQEKINLPTTPLEFLEILDDSEKKLLGWVPLCSSDNNFKENNLELLEASKYGISLKNNVICGASLLNSGKKKRHHENNLCSNNKLEIIYPEFKTFSPGKWVATYNGKKQKLYQSPVSSVTKNILKNNLSIANVSCLNPCSSANSLKDIDKMCSPGKWVLTAPGKKMKLYCSPDISTKSSNKLIYDFKLKSSTNSSQENDFFLKDGLVRFNSGVNGFYDSCIDYTDKNESFCVTDISFDSAIEKKVRFNDFTSLNSQEDSSCLENLHVDASESTKNNTGFLENIIDNTSYKSSLVNNTDNMQEFSINNKEDMNDSKISFMDQFMMNFNTEVMDGELFNFAKLSSSTIGLESLTGNIQESISNEFSFKSNDNFSELSKCPVFKEEHMEINQSIQKDIPEFQSIDDEKSTRNYDNQDVFMTEHFFRNHKKFNIMNKNICSIKSNDIGNNNFTDIHVCNQQPETADFMKLLNNSLDLRNRYIDVKEDKDVSYKNTHLIKDDICSLTYEEYKDLGDTKKVTNFFEDFETKKILNHSFSDKVSSKLDTDFLSIEKNNTSFETIEVLELDSNISQADKCFQSTDTNSSFVKIKCDTTYEGISVELLQEQCVGGSSSSPIKGSAGSIVPGKSKQGFIIEKSSKKTRELKPIRVSSRIREKAIKAINDKSKSESCEAVIFHENLCHNKYRITRNSRKAGDGNNNNIIGSAGQMKPSEEASGKKLIDNSIIPISKEIKLSSLKECTRMTRSRFLNEKLEQSKAQSNFKDLTNIKNLQHQVIDSRKDDIIADKIITKTLTKHNKENPKKRSVSQTISNIEKPSKRRSVLPMNDKNVKSSIKRVSLRNRSK